MVLLAAGAPIPRPRLPLPQKTRQTTHLNNYGCKIRQAFRAANEGVKNLTQAAEWFERAGDSKTSASLLEHATAAGELTQQAREAVVQRTSQTQSRIEQLKAELAELEGQLSHLKDSDEAPRKSGSVLPFWRGPAGSKSSSPFAESPEDEDFAQEYRDPMPVPRRPKDAVQSRG